MKRRSVENRLLRRAAFGVAVGGMVVAGAERMCSSDSTTNDTDSALDSHQPALAESLPKPLTRTVKKNKTSIESNQPSRDSKLDELLDKGYLGYEFSDENGIITAYNENGIACLSFNRIQAGWQVKQIGYTFSAMRLNEVGIELAEPIIKNAADLETVINDYKQLGNWSLQLDQLTADSEGYFVYNSKGEMLSGDAANAYRAQLTEKKEDLREIILSSTNLFIDNK